MGLLETNFSEMWIGFCHFHSRKCIWKCCLPKWRPFCPWGDELRQSMFTFSLASFSWAALMLRSRNRNVHVALVEIWTTNSRAIWSSSPIEENLNWIISASIKESARLNCECNRACRPGGHCWHHYLVAISSSQIRHCNSFEGRERVPDLQSRCGWGAFQKLFWARKFKSS